MEEYWKLNELPHADILNSLKTVEIRWFYGRKWEHDLVSYILQKAKFLEKMSFSELEQGSARELEKRKGKMRKNFTKLAPNVKILIS
ncbi:hypothetical protein AQUCO_02500038v1 [Aquilegia coerulea]|uniref:FBD domain-containing protein n=1 Tax=Aquilegia coerulea TaxID=218851 RepID=A0A2G5D940_AQUCA|nr:hypothetical protein AQUCO_02500038v1 [Aquilegia coerulea]